MGWFDWFKTSSVSSPGPSTGVPADAFPLGTVDVNRGTGDGASLQCDVGIETMAGLTPLIHAGTRLPAEKTETFSTWSAFQELVQIHAQRNEHALSKTSRTLRRVVICGVPLAQAGEPQIAVTFAVDESGNCRVWAKDKIRGNRLVIVAAEDLNVHLDGIRRRARAVRIASFETRKMENAMTGTALHKSAGIGATGLLFHGDTGLPAIHNDVRIVPMPGMLKLIDFVIRTFNAKNEVHGGGGVSVKNIIVDLPATTASIRVVHFVDDQGTYWFWAKDATTGEDLSAREKN